MKSFYKLTNVVRDYPWGHHSYIPDFLGLANVDDKPFAELWMGAHPGAPSRIDTESREGVSLEEWISEDKASSLGPKVAGSFGRLPFLFKFLAAGDSLSIQAHPSKTLAEEGFAREERAGILRDAPNRNYKDDNHKPEIIMALTRFTAMIGFRKPDDIMESFSELVSVQPKSDFLNDFRDNIKLGEEQALKIFLNTVLTMDSVTSESILLAAVSASDQPHCGWDRIQKHWVQRLAEQFPGDIGALAPLFLNIVELKPGEALFQPAGDLHAYLEGFGLELMANSDNVLRGGLTSKYVDVPELMTVLNFRSSDPDVLKTGDENRCGIRRYSTPAGEFALGLADQDTNRNTRIPSGMGPVIILSLEGNLVLNSETDKLKLSKGESAFIPWNAEDIEIEGVGRAAVAGVGT
jgi:mannose-6-phosphate isomerase